MRDITIGHNDAGQRLDAFLRKAFPHLPPSMLYRGIRLRRIKLNGGRCKPDTRLAQGDMLALYLSDDVLDRPADERLFLLAPPILDIVYEDDHILIVNKPAGLLVHEDAGESRDTLIARIWRYLYDNGAYDPDAEQSFAPALCHRIDKNTSGLVIAAKTAQALRILNDKIKAREIDKRYLLLVHGVPAPAAGELRSYLRKDEARNIVRVFDTPQPGARTAVTHYRVLRSKNGVSLVEAALETGRTHQIRAQFAHVGHPLVGDGKYGHNADDRARGFRHQVLCAYKLTFAFTSDAGVLDYLNGMTFEIRAPFTL